MSEKLRVTPLTLKQANELISKFHRHHKPVVGHRFSIGAERTPTVEELKQLLPTAWPEGKPHGQCAITALVVQDFYGGTLMRGRMNDESHYWNRLPDNSEIDLTREQFPADCQPTGVIERERSYVLSFPTTCSRYKQLKQRLEVFYPCGAAVVGRPVARETEQYKIAEVTRLVTDGTKNACSLLYSACARAAKAMGFESIQTYILESESGTSLKAAGWEFVSNTAGGDWNHSWRKGRRTDQPQCPKQKWAKKLS